MRHGNFVDPHKIYSVLLSWVLQYKGWPGAVTRAFNTTKMLDRIARKYGRELIEHGIGFKYVCRPHARARNRHGRRGVGRHRLPAPPARARRPAQLSASRQRHGRRKGKTLGQLVAELQAEYGEHQYGRIDLHVPEVQKNAVIARARALKPGDPVFAGMPIYCQENLDGVKFYLDNPEATSKPKAAETWLLLRASGTEPLLRIYTESCSKESVAKLLDSARAFALHG